MSKLFMKKKLTSCDISIPSPTLSPFHNVTKNASVSMAIAEPQFAACSGHEN